jgi:hypothetical protein
LSFFQGFDLIPGKITMLLFVSSLGAVVVTVVDLRGMMTLTMMMFMFSIISAIR